MKMKIAKIYIDPHEANFLRSYHLAFALSRMYTPSSHVATLLNVHAALIRMEYSILSKLVKKLHNNLKAFTFSFL